MRPIRNPASVAIVGLCVGAAMTGALMSGAARGQAGPPDHLVTQAQFDRWKTELSNAGRWGKDDEKGTANLIMPAKRKQAAALVKDGFAVSLARDGEFGHEMVRGPWNRPDGSTDRIAVAFHGYTYTHLDGLGQ